VDSQGRVQPPTFRFHKRGGPPVRVVRSKRGCVPMCACGRDWLPLLLSASDRKIPVFTEVNGTLTVRRLSLAGVILGLSFTSLSPLTNPRRAGTLLQRRVPGQRAVMCALGPPGVGFCRSARRARPPSLAGGAGGAPGYGIS
jgi:hypothetical protein